MTLQYATFYLGPTCFGVDVLRVQELLGEQDLTAVPRATPDIRGLINLRGHIVTAIDLRRRLGLPDNPQSGPSMNVILRGPEGLVSLLVDRVGDVLEAPEASFEALQVTAGHTCVRGVHKLQGGLLTVLDVDKLL